MKNFLLPESGSFYKANLHCHSTVSDGELTPEEIKREYKDMGYSIVAYTDHNVMIPHHDLSDRDFLALTGFEIEFLPAEGYSDSAKTCHVCFVAIEKENEIQPLWHREKYVWGDAAKYQHLVKIDESEPDYERVYTPECVSRFMKIARDKGFFVTYNHPTWSFEGYEEYINYEGMHAFEIVNGSSAVGGFDEYNARVYADFLNAGKQIYCIAADDNHNRHPKDSKHWDSGVGYTMIKADSLSYGAITSALEKGHFYASTGPEIYDLWFEDGVIHLNCSPVFRAIVSTDTRVHRVPRESFKENDMITSASFEVDKNAKYIQIIITDAHGERAYTNAYCVRDLYENSEA